MKYSASLFVFLLLSTFRYSSADKKPDMLKHYATHIITDGLAHIAAEVSIITGLIAAEKLEKKQLSGLAATSFLAGSAIALYTIYKTPQWTDKFILNYSKERSTSQNIITFVCRLFFPFPLGTLLGEFEVEKNLEEVPQKS